MVNNDRFLDYEQLKSFTTKLNTHLEYRLKYIAEAPLEVSGAAITNWDNLATLSGGTALKGNTFKLVASGSTSSVTIDGVTYKAGEFVFCSNEAATGVTVIKLGGAAPDIDNITIIANADDKLQAKSAINISAIPATPLQETIYYFTVPIVIGTDTYPVGAYIYDGTNWTAISKAAAADMKSINKNTSDEFQIKLYSSDSTNNTSGLEFAEDASSISGLRVVANGNSIDVSKDGVKVKTSDQGGLNVSDDAGHEGLAIKLNAAGSGIKTSTDGTEVLVDATTTIIDTDNKVVAKSAINVTELPAAPKTEATYYLTADWTDPSTSTVYKAGAYTYVGTAWCAYSAAAQVDDESIKTKTDGKLAVKLYSSDDTKADSGLIYSADATTTKTGLRLNLDETTTTLNTDYKLMAKSAIEIDTFPTTPLTEVLYRLKADIEISGVTYKAGFYYYDATSSSWKAFTATVENDEITITKDDNNKLRANALIPVSGSLPTNPVEKVIYHFTEEIVDPTLGTYPEGYYSYDKTAGDYTDIVGDCIDYDTILFDDDRNLKAISAYVVFQLPTSDIKTKVTYFVPEDYTSGGTTVKKGAYTYWDGNWIAFDGFVPDDLSLETNVQGKTQIKLYYAGTSQIAGGIIFAADSSGYSGLRLNTDDNTTYVASNGKLMARSMIVTATAPTTSYPNTIYYFTSDVTISGITYPKGFYVFIAGTGWQLVSSPYIPDTNTHTKYTDPSTGLPMFRADALKDVTDLTPADHAYGPVYNLTMPWTSGGTTYHAGPYHKNGTGFDSLLKEDGVTLTATDDNYNMMAKSAINVTELPSSPKAEVMYYLTADWTDPTTSVTYTAGAYTYVDPDWKAIGSGSVDIDNLSIIKNTDSKLAVQLSTKGGLETTTDTTTGAGVKVKLYKNDYDVDVSGLKLDTTGLGIKLSSGSGVYSGLTLDSSGLAVSIDNTTGLEFQSLGGKIGIKYDADGGLTASMADGLNLNIQKDKSCIRTELNNGVYMSLDSCLKLVNEDDTTTDKMLSLNIKTNAGLTSDDNGLSALTDDASGTTLNSTTGAIEVKPDTVNGIKLTDNGVALNIKASSGLTCTSDGLQASLASDGGLHFSSGQIAINPGSTINVDSTSNQVDVKIKENYGLQITTDGLGVKPDVSQGIDLSANGVKVVLDTSSGLDFDMYTGGLKINPNSTWSGLTVDSDGVKLTTKYSSGTALPTSGTDGELFFLYTT